MKVRRVGIETAREGVARVHRHLDPPPRALVAFEVIADGWPVGWATVGRPVSRVLQARGWVEVTRVATDGTRNACSMLYGAAARWAWAEGRPVLTYTLPVEGGASLRGAGWVTRGVTRERNPADWSSRPRRHSVAFAGAPKVRWVPPWCAELWPLGWGPDGRP